MPSLRQLAASHGPLLILDAASTRIQVGVWRGDAPAKSAGDWRTSDEEAGIGVFRCIEALGVNLDEIGAFVFCEGPGSILGIRTSAMAIRTWNVLRPRPVFTYGSLALLAQALARPDLGVIADARRDSWHRFQLGGENAGALRRVPTAELGNGPLAMPENFRHWSALPTGVERVPYVVADLLATPRVAEAELFHHTEAPDAFLHEEPSYVTWTPQVHRAPGAPSAPTP